MTNPLPVPPPTPPPAPGPPAPPPVPPAPPGPTPPPTPPTDPGPAGGQAAVLADLARVRAENHGLKERLDKLGPLEQLAAALGGGDPDKGKTELEQITTRLEAQETATKAANLRALAATVEAKASNWKDPADAALHLGSLDKYLKADGTVDTTQIQTDLAAVLATKAYLAKDDTPPPRGSRQDPAQGPRGGDATGGTVSAGRDMYAQRHKKP